VCVCVCVCVLQQASCIIGTTGLLPETLPKHGSVYKGEREAAVTARQHVIHQFHQFLGDISMVPER